MLRALSHGNEWAGTNFVDAMDPLPRATVSAETRLCELAKDALRELAVTPELGYTSIAMKRAARALERMHRCIESMAEMPGGGCGAATEANSVIECTGVAVLMHECAGDAPGVCEDVAHALLTLLAGIASLSMADAGPPPEHAMNDETDVDALQMHACAVKGAREAIEVAVLGDELAEGAACEDDEPPRRSQRDEERRGDLLRALASSLAVQGSDGLVRASTRTYFWATMRCMRRRQLGRTVGCFGTLAHGTPGAPAHQLDGVAVEAMLHAAESELGQLVARDMLISFRAPIGKLGLRTGLLLPSATTTAIGEHNLDIISEAHEWAMAGVVAMYTRSGADPATRTAAVLAALAVALAGREADLRASRAFGGAVQLPFLAVQRPAKGFHLAYDDGTDAWLLLAVEARGAVVRARRHGVAGLGALAAVLLATRVEPDR